MKEGINLSPRSQDAAQLIDALWAAHRGGRNDLHASVAALTTHHVATVREEALGLLLVIWRDVRYRPLAARAMLEDDDAGVRGRAALGLGAASTARTRSEDIRLLLRMLRDDNEEADTRRAAYEGLLILCGRKTFPSYLTPFDARRDTDPEFISELERGIQPT